MTTRTHNGITYQLKEQGKQPPPLCCHGCEIPVPCGQWYPNECSNSDNLDKVWKRVTNEETNDNENKATYSTMPPL